MNPSKQEYQKMAEKASPGSPFLKNALMAFLFGGAICCLGQGLVNLYMYWGLEPVSYTHLDVYKRQAQDRRISFSAAR